MTRPGPASTVERVDGWDDYLHPGRPTTTWLVTYNGELLGNALDEAEGWRWIEDMKAMEARARGLTP